MCYGLKQIGVLLVPFHYCGVRFGCTDEMLHLQTGLNDSTAAYMKTGVQVTALRAVDVSGTFQQVFTGLLA